MALDEAMRHRIHGRLAELLGHDEAAALMGELPPAEPATKADLALLGQRLDGRIDRLEDKIDGLEQRFTLQIKESVASLGGELRAEMNSMMRWAIGGILTAMSLGIAAGRLL